MARTVDEAMALLSKDIPEEDRDIYRRWFERYPKLRDSAEHVQHIPDHPTLRYA